VKHLLKLKEDKIGLKTNTARLSPAQDQAIRDCWLNGDWPVIVLYTSIDLGRTFDHHLCADLKGHQIYAHFQRT